MKKNGKLRVAGFLRIAIVVLVILLQLALIGVLTHTMRTAAMYVYLAIEFFAIVEIIVMVSRNRNSAYTIGWILVIAFLPVFGYILYILWGRSGSQGRRNERLRASIAHGEEYLDKDPEIYAGIGKKYPHRKRTSGYLGRKGFPLYRNTDIKYYPLGELQFDAMLEDFEKAEKFIFLEYFIVGDGKLWSRFEDVLTRKAAQGVEVRLMYDDFGSILTLSGDFMKRLENAGIMVRRFNPIHRFIAKLYLNYRNHQKIAVIDGNTAYTGGTNLADEYANYYPKHGHWKDTAIRMYGDAVWSLTVTFLQMWDGEKGERSDYNAYRPTESGKSESFVQPFYDGPLNNPDNPAEFMYRTIIANAREYVYITTPYLVINNSMLDILIGAAESGVDVRIITPKVWDHWYVHAVSRSNYKDLLAAGVRIYEYSPGYIHAKTIICDDDHGVTGSINMDYRSFNLHFENGVWICGDPVLQEIKTDIMDTFAVSEEIDQEEYLSRPWYYKAVGGFLRVFAVLF